MNGFEKPDPPRQISEGDAIDLQRRGVLAMNPDRTLPLWFDGRFLTARDLNRQQSYFNARHASLSRSVGNGVIEGLEVAQQPGSSLQDTIRISPGQGFAFDGAHINLPTEMHLNLADLSVQSALNAQLGLSTKPSAPLNTRSGLFVLSLRAVEFTANQTTSFPQTVTGERTVHMGDKIEAVAATLTPFAPTQSALTNLDARADAAHRIFATGKIDGVPSYALPLAMLSLNFGSIKWIDVDLVRRDLVAARREFLGLGLAQDQLRLAHFEQYRAALDDVMADYAANSQPARFPAEQHFKLLPPAGPLPADAVDAAGMAQVFFPGEVEVELSVIPDDELPALIEESFDLPPIDLTRPAEERDGLSVMIVAPMPRHALRSQLTGLEELTRPLRPLSLLGNGPQKPLDRLGAMKIRLADAAARRVAPASATAQNWATIVAELTNFTIGGGQPSQRKLWYMRRRTLRRSADLESVLVAVTNADPSDDTDIPSPVEPVPEPTPTPDPVSPTPAPDPLPDRAKVALIKLAGFGELAKVAEVQLRRVNKPVAEVFANGILETDLSEDAISTTAFVARLEDGAANARAKLEGHLKSILEANEKGRALLSSGLIGQGATEVSAERLKLLKFFLVEDDQFERTANSLPKLKRDLQRELTIKVGELIKEQRDDSVRELIKEIEGLADEAERPAPAPSPTPQPAPTPSPAEDREARRESESQALAKKLIESLPQKGDQRRMRAALDKATTEQRLEISRRLSNAKLGASRIATGAALAALATGGNLSPTALARVRTINASMVSGLQVLESRLLKVEQQPAPTPTPAPRPTPAPGRGNFRVSDAVLRRGGLNTVVTGINPTVNPNFTRNHSAILSSLILSPVDRRIGLLSKSSQLHALATFGRKNRRNSRKLNTVAKGIITALDKQNATTVSVDRAIAQLFRRNV